MRIGYAKMGRCMQLDPAEYGPQGDPEAPNLLRRLALRNPQHEFMIIGKNNGWENADMPANVRNPWHGFPRSPWCMTSKQNYVHCAYCKADWRVPENMYQCCDKARDCRAMEEWLIGLAAGGHFDGIIVHVGQHGTSSLSITDAKSPWSNPKMTNPQMWTRNYSAFLIEILNAHGDRSDGKAPVGWICVDPRNYLKARDVKWPTGYDHILSQYRFTRPGKHERYRDPRTPRELGFNCETERGGELWLAQHKYVHGGLELMILDDDWATWGQKGFHERVPVGVATTSSFVEERMMRRSYLTQTWVLQHFPDAPVFGRWDDASLEDAPGIELQSNTVAEFPDVIGSFRVTVSLPPTSRGLDGNMWSVAKPYQCFAANTVCFFVNVVDEQGWVLPSRHKTKVSTEVAPGLYSVRNDWTEQEISLARWLRCDTADEFKVRAQQASTDEGTWRWLVNAQRALLRRHWDMAVCETTLEQMMGLR